MTIFSSERIAGISVIIATRNRCAYLGSLIDHWRKVDLPAGVEIIFVDNGSTDETFSVLAGAAKQLDCSVKVVAEPRAGLSIARNTGVALSTGQLLAFTDDDCYPRSDLIAQIQRVFEDTDVAFAGGRVLLHDPEDLPLTLQERNEPLDLAPGNFLPSGCIHGANMACTRETFDALGGFDPDLGAGKFFSSGEDTDFMRRAMGAGFRGRYDPELVVYHHHRRRAPEDRKKLHRSYDRGIGAGFMKYLLRAKNRCGALRSFYWHLKTMPLRRAARQINFFVLYGLFRSFRGGQQTLNSAQPAIKTATFKER